MKKHVMDFLMRGFVASGFGPVVLGVLYLILQYNGVIEVLNVSQVCVGIFSIYVLAFVAGGMNSIYQIERLPLMVAILIHGVVLYVVYLVTYLVNDWLAFGLIPVLAFSCIFVFGYFAVWAVIYSITKSNTKSLNEKLKKKQQIEEKSS